jgi:hypothetical protein
VLLTDCFPDETSIFKFPSFETSIFNFQSSKF